MSTSTVGIVKYSQPLESVRQAVDLAGGFRGITARSRVFLKPNIVVWSKESDFPKWGVITTSRVVEDTVRLLKEQGVDDITIGEGTVVMNPKDRETQVYAYRGLGYDSLKKRYGVKTLNVFERPFEKVDLGDISLNFNTDILHSDYVVNLPVLKTHAVTVVSLGLKNLKGVIDVDSRKKCHNADAEKNLHYYVSRLADPLPPMFTLLDGIYTIERGPTFEGKARRSNVLVASEDVLSADMVGAKVLGHDPSETPHLVYAARNRARPLDLSDIRLVGEPLESVASYHENEFAYTEDESLPVPLQKMGIQGLSYRKYDMTMCTYCSGINGPALAAIVRAWNGTPWDEVEVLTGKIMRPTPGKKKTILIGKCMYQANKDNPDIQEMLAVKGCPPSIKSIVKAFHKAGIQVDPAAFEHMDQYPSFFMKRYVDKPEFESSFFTVP